MSTYLLIPLEDTVVFPNMNITLPIDVGDEERVLLVPTKDGEYAKVGVLADVVEVTRLPRGITAVSLVAQERAVARAPPRPTPTAASASPSRSTTRSSRRRSRPASWSRSTAP